MGVPSKGVGLNDIVESERIWGYKLALVTTENEREYFALYYKLQALQEIS